MSQVIKFDDEYISIAKNMVIALESGDHKEANNLLNKLTNKNDSVIFQEIGKLTRELHDTLASFEADVNIADLAENEIPDAKKRLNYVIEKTDEAANTTLNIIEKCMPVCEQMEKESRQINDEWKKFMSKDMNADDFRALTKKLSKYIENNASAYHDVKTGMSDITLAQGFQDITGQIIKKVINLVQEVEDNLIRVIKVTGSINDKNKSEKGKLEGPQIPGLHSSEAVSGQDEVDDILSSLGF